MVLPKRCYEIRLTEMEWLRNKFLCFKDEDISRLMKMALTKIHELTNGLINFVSFHKLNICYGQNHVIQ
jgi:hypothetical protein